MKNFIFSLALVTSITMSSQITLNYTHDTRRFLTKLDYGGFVYYTINAATETIDLFDVSSNTLIKSMAVPNFTTAGLDEIHLSDNLFDTDLLVEFIVFRAHSNTFDLEIYNELGTLIFSLTNCVNVWYNNGTPLHIPILKNDHLVFYDGVSTKMEVYRISAPNMGAYEVYDLPGSLPCIQCSPEGPTVGVKSNKISKSEEANFFPNPVTKDERLKLKYSIPPATKNARVKVYDVNGKLLDDVRISSATDYILLPSSYNNGFYVYALEIDGKIVKNEKIILDK